MVHDIDERMFPTLLERASLFQLLLVQFLCFLVFANLLFYFARALQVCVSQSVSHCVCVCVSQSVIVCTQDKARLGEIDSESEYVGIKLEHQSSQWQSIHLPFQQLVNSCLLWRSPGPFEQLLPDFRISDMYLEAIGDCRQTNKQTYNESCVIGDEAMR
jgi:hypothetical protein